MSNAAQSNGSNVADMSRKVDDVKLKKYNKDDLVGYIRKLENRVDELESYSLIAKRVELLERSYFQSVQYNRRDSLEIAGIPGNVDDKNLESTTLAILEEIGVGKVESGEVYACHRMKNKKNTIIKFTSRKSADTALYKRKNLKDMNMNKFGFSEQTRIYINESLCPMMSYMFYKVRQARKNKLIYSYNLWKGNLTIKLNEDGLPIPIAHIRDLIDVNLADESDLILVYKPDKKTINLL